MPKPIFVLNGPNLNLLGEREPHIYGHESLADVEARCVARAKVHGLTVDFRQSNREGELIDWVQEARLDASALVINPAGYGHTSIALHDSLKALQIPIIECHISNPAAREPFRHHSYVSTAASGVICGLGVFGYELAIDAARHLLAAPRTLA
jgi:3-dehydroquinate dehydratase-2